jgi:hypothetical protein
VHLILRSWFDLQLNKCDSIKLATPFHIQTSFFLSLVCIAFSHSFCFFCKSESATLYSYSLLTFSLWHVLFVHSVRVTIIHNFQRINYHSIFVPRLLLFLMKAIEMQIIWLFCLFNNHGDTFLLQVKIYRRVNFKITWIKAKTIISTKLTSKSLQNVSN